MKRLSLIFLLLFGIITTTSAQDDGTMIDQETIEAAINLVINQPDFAEKLEAYPNYTTETYASMDAGTQLLKIDFIVYVGDVIVKFASTVVNISNNLIVESYLVAPLPDEDINKQSSDIIAFVAADEKLHVMFDDFAGWYIFTIYDLPGGFWDVVLERGLEVWVITVNITESPTTPYMITKIDERGTLTDLEAEENRRNRAIMLAYGHPATNDMLSKTDDWQTLVRKQSDSLYTVEFISGETSLLCILVDITTDSAQKPSENLEVIDQSLQCMEAK